MYYLIICGDTQKIYIASDLEVHALQVTWEQYHYNRAISIAIEDRSQEWIESKLKSVDFLLKTILYKYFEKNFGSSKQGIWPKHTLKCLKKELLIKDI